MRAPPSAATNPLSATSASWIALRNARWEEDMKCSCRSAAKRRSRNALSGAGKCVGTAQARRCPRADHARSGVPVFRLDLDEPAVAGVAQRDDAIDGPVLDQAMLQR